MKITVFGKHGGVFTGSDGRDVRFYKISCIIPIAQRDGDYVVTGYSAEKSTVSRDIFAALPDDREAYDGGIECNVEFDYKGNIISLDVA